MAAQQPRVLLAEGVERTVRFTELAEQVQVKDGRLVVRVLRGEDIVSYFLRVGKDGAKKPSKRAVPEPLLHTYCTASLGEERVTSLTVHGTTQPQWVCSIDTELSLREAEQMVLYVNVCHADSTSPDLQTAADEGLELPDRIGFLELRIIDVLREMVDDDYKSIAYALRTEHTGNGGSVVLLFNYKSHVILTEADYANFLALLACSDYLLLKLLARLRIPLNAEFPLCLVSLLMHRGDITAAASALVVDHVARNTDITGNDIFRDESLASNVVEDYMKIAARTYIDRVVGPLVAEMIARNLNCEIYPPMIKPPDTAASALANLRTYLDWFLPLLFSSAPLFPSSVCQILAAMANAAGTARPHTQHIRLVTVSSFVFLRLLNPVLLAPHQYGLMPAVDFQGNLPRALVYMAKTLQFGAKEDFMAPLNAIVERYTADMVRFLEVLSSEALLSPPAEHSGLTMASMSMNTELPFGNDAGSQASDEPSPEMKARWRTKEDEKPRRRNAKSPRVPKLPLSPGREAEDDKRENGGRSNGRMSAEKGEDDKGDRSHRNQDRGEGEEEVTNEEIERSPRMNGSPRNKGRTPRSARREKSSGSKTKEKRSKLQRTKSREHRHSLAIERPRSVSASGLLLIAGDEKDKDVVIGPSRPRQRSREELNALPEDEGASRSYVRTQPAQSSARHSRVTISSSGGHGGHLRRASSTTPRAVRIRRADSVDGLSEGDCESLASAASSNVTPRSEVSASEANVQAEELVENEKNVKKKLTVENLKPKKKNMFKQRFARRTMVVTASEQEALQRDKAAWLERMAASDKTITVAGLIASDELSAMSDPVLKTASSASALPALTLAKLPSLAEGPDGSHKGIQFKEEKETKEVTRESAYERPFPGRAVARVHRQVAHDYRALMNALLELHEMELRESLESVMGRMAVKEAKSRAQRARELDMKAPLSARVPGNDVKADKRRTMYKKNRAKSVGEVKPPPLRHEQTAKQSEGSPEALKKKHISPSIRRCPSRSEFSDRLSEGAESYDTSSAMPLSSSSTVPHEFATPREHGERRGLVGRLRALSSSRNLKHDKGEGEGKKAKKEKKHKVLDEGSEATS